MALSPYQITSIIIDSVTYEIRSINVKDGKSYKTYENCLVTLKYGTKKLGLYQWGNQTAADKMLVRRESWPALIPITHPTVNDYYTWYQILRECEKLRTEMEEKKENKGIINTGMSSDEKIMEIKRIIDQSANCL